MTFRHLHAVDSSEVPRALPSVTVSTPGGSRFTLSITSYSGLAAPPEIVAASDGSEPQTGPARPVLRLA